MRRPGWSTVVQLPIAVLVLHTWTFDMTMGPRERLATLFILTVMLVVSVTIHEFAHASIGSWTTSRSSTVLLYGPLLGAAILNDDDGGPVEDWNPVSVAAGPLANLALAAMVWVAMNRLLPTGDLSMQAWHVRHFLGMFCGLNVGIGLANLLPVVPLDGGRLLAMIAAWMPGSIRRQFDAFLSGLGSGLAIMVLWCGLCQNGPVVASLFPLTVWSLIVIVSLMGVASTGWSHIGETAVGVICGAAFGLYVAVPFLW